MDITTVARNIDEANDDDKPKSYAEAYPLACAEARNTPRR